MRKRVAEHLALLDKAINNEEEWDKEKIEYLTGSSAALAACEQSIGRIPFPSVQRLLAEYSLEHPNISKERERGFYNTYAEFQNMRKMNTWRDVDGYLIPFADGGYPVYYLDQDNSTYCPKCANEEEEGNSQPATIIVFRIVAGGVHWEGEPLICDKCNMEIESAYGDPDEEE